MTTQLQAEYKAPSHIARPGAPEAVVLPDSLMGTWVNVNRSTNDLARIVITPDGNHMNVNPYGACVPTPCNWGTSPATVYAPNVSSSQAIAFRSEFTFGFSKIRMVGHMNGNELLVETFTEFTDGSGRSSLYTTDTMVR